MQIKWNVEGATELRLFPHEWTWLQAALAKVKPEAFPRACDQFAIDLSKAKPIAIKLDQPQKPEVPYL